MHNLDTKAIYQDFLPDFLNDMRDTICLAKNAGIPDYILSYSGVGFGKNYEMNLEIIREVGQMHRAAPVIRFFSEHPANLLLA